MEFIEANGKDPEERGQYLVIYTDKGSDIENYQLTYYRPKEDGDKAGFYIDVDCTLENEVRRAFNWEIKKYMFLPNLLTKDGKYLPLDIFDETIGKLS